jgi:hypothetical protein
MESIMDAGVLLAHVRKNTEMVGKIACANLNWKAGFAIPAPREATDEDLRAIDRELSKLAWNFERITIQGRVCHVLFP